MPHLRSRAFPLVAACALAVAGCDPDAPSAPTPSASGAARDTAGRSPGDPAPVDPPAPVLAPRVQVARWTPTPGGPRMAALATGTLAVVDGCLGVALGPGEAMLVAFPYDAAWDDGAQTLTLRGETHALGDTVSLGGGGVGVGSYRLGDGPHDVPPCVTDRVWLTD